MAQPDQNPSTTEGEQKNTAMPNGPNGKASAVAPKLSDEDQVELSDMLPSGPEEVSPEDDIMQLARLGDIPGIESLYDSGKFEPTYSDPEGMTPLHWAALNNQYAMCQFLIKAGAEVNKKGGDSLATAAMWAAQRCHYYTVNLLLQHGADSTITDNQGYSILHLATFGGNVLLLTLLLHHDIDIDMPDAQGHTCLMWAAFNGFPQCVDLFLRWGADVRAVDENGFTALHWALVKGSPGCIQKLLEYGSDRFVHANNGKAPADTAVEMKTEAIWLKALTECGYNDDATPKTIEFPGSTYIFKDKRGSMNKFFFLFPFVILWVMIALASYLPVYVGIPFALLAGYSLQWIALQVLEYAPTDMRHIHKTPWLAGIFAATLFWVGLRWLTVILPGTYLTMPLSNLAFAGFYGLCGYFYFCTMVYEPGFVPKLGGITQQKEVIDELLALWAFDEQNFCVACMVRRPLRSKHCKRCGRCIAKHDHHCPWVFNCIGINNHRHFLLYLINLELGIAVIVRLAIGYFESIQEHGSDKCNILAPSLCKVVNSDPFTLVLTFWAMLQLTWVTMLLFVQCIQISRALTTYENMRGVNHGHHGSKASEAITSALTTGTASRAGAQIGSTGMGPDPALPPTHAPGHGHSHNDGCFSQWKKILGVDTFVETALHAGDPVSRRNRNPFSAGCVGNCKDFFCDEAPVFGKRESGAALLNGRKVDYTAMYETPRMTTTTTRRQAGGGVGGTYESVQSEEGV